MALCLLGSQAGSDLRCVSGAGSVAQLDVFGLDGVFIGRGDLAAAYASTDDAATAVRQATETVLAAAAKAGRRVAILPGTPEYAAVQARAGATAFILSSDQGFLRAAAKSTHDTISGAVVKATKG